MTFKKIGIVLFLVFCLLPISNLSAETSNAGFVSGNIWYSQDPFEEGDKIKIYTLIFNPDSRELSGTVIFFDKTIFLGKKDFTISSKSARDISIDWTVTAGDHQIFGKIENAKFLISKGKYEEVYLNEDETEKSSRTVSKKIVANSINNTDNDQDTASISDIKKIIEEKTPSFISEPIISIANKAEKLREDTNIASENKKEEVQKEINVLENNKNKTTTENFVLKPFKYIEKFFLIIFSFITSNSILFYGISILVIVFILRFIWRKIF